MTTVSASWVRAASKISSKPRCETIVWVSTPTPNVSASACV